MELLSILNGAFWGVLPAVVTVELIKLIAQLKDKNKFEIYRTVGILFIALFGPLALYCENVIQKNYFLSEDWSSNSFTFSVFVTVLLYGFIRRVTVDIEHLKAK